jgi:hypothetical protein
MASAPPSPGPALSEIESTLSTAPPTSFLDRVEADIGIRSNSIEVDSQATPAITDPSTLQPNTLEVKRIKYIEVLLKPEGKRAQSAWYWDHGKEWECQKADPSGKYSIGLRLGASFEPVLRRPKLKVGRHWKYVLRVSCVRTE